MLAQALVAVLGVWLMVAPAVLGYGGAAATSDRIAGPAIAAIAFVAATAVTRGLRWLNVPAALWLLIAPWVLGFPTAATVNAVLVGAAVLVLAPRGRSDVSRFGGGWRSLVRD